MTQKILDPCCGSRMFHFDKQNPNVLFGDIRCEDLDLNNGNRTCHIRPDQILDFRKLPFENETFYLVVFDPPHLKRAGPNSWLAKKYGVLGKDWQNDIKLGFDECMRVLKPNSTLIFKWNEDQITVKQILDLIQVQPVFGHRTKKNTIWMTFFKQ